MTTTLPVQPAPVPEAPEVPRRGDPAFDVKGFAFTSWQAEAVDAQNNQAQWINDALDYITGQSGAADADANRAEVARAIAQQEAANAAQSAVIAASGANATPWSETGVYVAGTPTSPPSVVFDPLYSPGVTYRAIADVGPSSVRPADDRAHWAVMGVSMSADPTSGPSSGALLRDADGTLTGVHSVLDGKLLDFALTRDSSGLIAAVSVDFNESTRTISFQRDSDGVITGFTAAITLGGSHG
jgi:hypothetical protein